MPVRTDYDREADFSGYKTYNWISDDPLIVPAGRTPAISPLNTRRILTAIEMELDRKGYARVAAGDTADFAVAFTVGTRERIDIDSYPRGYRGPWYWRPSYWNGGIHAITYEEGMLAIDIFDVSTRQPVWHGSTRKVITQRDVDYPAPVIREAVAAILAKFPP